MHPCVSYAMHEQTASEGLRLMLTCMVWQVRTGVRMGMYQSQMLANVCLQLFTAHMSAMQ